MILFWDIILSINYVLFFLIAGEVFSIVYYHWNLHKTRHNTVQFVQPIHVVLVGAILLAFATEAMYYNIHEAGTNQYFWTLYNFVALSFTAYGLGRIYLYKRRRNKQYSS